MDNYFSDNDPLDDYDVDLIPEPDLSAFDINNKLEEEQKLGETNVKDDDLGVDEEVKVRKRKAAVKLDENRLLSDQGLPLLQRTAAKRLKFKGKGHEIHDLGKIVAFYQLWADNLYPKATFRDSLAIIEKLGHSKTMKAHRLGLIQTYKDSMLDVGAEQVQGEKDTGDNTAEKAQGRAEKQTSRNAQTGKGNADNDDDDDAHLYTNDAIKSKPTRNKDSLFLDDDDEDDEEDDDIPLNRRSRRPQLDSTASNTQMKKDKGKDKDGNKHDEEEDEDFDLDEMLAQSEQMHQETIRKNSNDKQPGTKTPAATATVAPASGSTSTTTKKGQEADDFDDEMEAMAALDQDDYMN